MNHYNPHTEIQRGIKNGIFHQATANAVISLLTEGLTYDDRCYIVIALKEAIRITMQGRHWQIGKPGHQLDFSRKHTRRLVTILRKLGYRAGRIH